jgi:hypothetical protein
VNRIRAALAVAFLVACGDAPSTIDDPAAFLAELRTAECEYLVGCGLYADAAQCAQRRGHPGLPFETWVPLPGDDAWPRNVAAGTMSYDGDRAAACIDTLRKGTCSPEEPMPSCWGVFRGTATAGTVTRSEAECASGYWSQQSCDDRCCTGTCGGDAGGPILRAGPSSEGEYCGADSTGFIVCVSHLACIDNTCVRLDAGDACEGNRVCPVGMSCDGTCGPRSEIGEVCTIGYGEDSCNRIGAYCGADGRCQSFGVEGDACDETSRCRPGLGCGPGGRCVAVLAAGEACGLGVPCDTGLYCGTGDGESLRCIPKLGDGEPCENSEQCASHYCASSMRCEPMTCM